MRNACFCFGGLPFWHQKSTPKLILFSGHLFRRFYIDFMRHWLVLGHLQIRADAKMGTEIDQAEPNRYPNLCRGPPQMCSWKNIYFVDEFRSASGSLWVPCGFQLAKVSLHLTRSQDCTCASSELLRCHFYF